MEHTASFLFYFSLNDFLLAKERNTPVSYTYNNSPAIKDAIEAIGVPHTEVDLIIVNNNPVDFHYQLQNLDVVEVYPLYRNNSFPLYKSLTEKFPNPVKFILDVHLGKLARTLRLLGFDSLYQNNYSDKEIISLSENEGRIILTRDIGLLKHKVIKWGYWLRSQQPEDQLKEVLDYFNLHSVLQPFSRCILCNNTLYLVEKEIVLDKLPPKTIEYFNEFYQCSGCKKIYWKGSHYENMLKLIERVKAH